MGEGEGEGNARKRGCAGGTPALQYPRESITGERERANAYARATAMGL